MDTYKFTIEDLGPKGDGICRTPGGPVFVDRGLPGESVRAVVRRDKMGLARAEIVDLLEPSPMRQVPLCPHYSQCGNCTVQHLKDENYREWKAHLVSEALTQQRLRPEQWLAPIFISGHHRRRATFTALKTPGKTLFGYYRRRSQEIVDIRTCSVVHPDLMALRDRLAPLLDQILVTGRPTDFFIQLRDSEAELIITGPLGRSARLTPALRFTFEALIQTSSLCRVGWRPDFFSRVEILVERGPLLARFVGLEVVLPPAAFLQPTQAGEEALTTAVSNALPEKGKFADLFSGCGTLTGPLLERGSVDAFESDPAAVTALKKARIRKLQATRRDLFRRPLPPDILSQYDGIVVDPPRAGCLEQIQSIARSQAPLVISVSCNPATFARDASSLVRGGYRLTSVQVIDQFHWSHHVELVGIFRRVKRPC